MDTWLNPWGTQVRTYVRWVTLIYSLTVAGESKLLFRSTFGSGVDVDAPYADLDHSLYAGMYIYWYYVLKHFAPEHFFYCFFSFGEFKRPGRFLNVFTLIFKSNREDELNWPTIGGTEPNQLTPAPTHARTSHMRIAHCGVRTLYIRK